MKINYPLNFEMSGCHDCECMISGEDQYDCYCFLDKKDIKLIGGDIIDIIPEDCPARVYEIFDMYNISKDIINEIKNKFNCNSRYETSIMEEEAHFIIINSKKIYDSDKFHEWVMDMDGRLNKKYNYKVIFNYCCEEF
jgi:hypothetical protein